jgi:hypothetical protein
MMPAAIPLLLPAVSQQVMLARVSASQHSFAGVALHKKDAERSLQDIETTLLVCAQQCALDDEEEVSKLWLVSSSGVFVVVAAAVMSFASMVWLYLGNKFHLQTVDYMSCLGCSKVGFSRFHC